jgi:hypothetical protein
MFSVVERKGSRQGPGGENVHGSTSGSASPWATQADETDRRETSGTRSQDTARRSLVRVR